jgi:hypothetical protein
LVNFSSSRLEYSLLELFGKGFSKSVSYAVLLLLVKNVEPLSKKATEAVAPFFFQPARIHGMDTPTFVFENTQRRGTTMIQRLTLPIGVLAASAFMVAGKCLSAERTQAVKVLQASEQAIQIEFIPQYHSPRIIKANDTEFVEYDFDESVSLASPRDAGAPELKYKQEPLGFQAKEGNVVQVVAADYEEIPNVLLKPTPTLHTKDEMLVVKEYAINPVRYAENRFLPGSIAELSPVSHVRSMFIGGVKFFPLQYNPLTKTLRKYSRIVVEVVYQPSTVPRIRTGDAAMFHGALLNFAQAKQWMYGSPRAASSPAGTPSVLSTGRWYRLTVAEEGMYALDASWFTANGISLTGVNPKTIEIYGNSGEELPENVAAPRPVDLVENAIYVEGEENDRWDPTDRVIFYGRGVQGIKYDPNAKTIRHYIHHYGRLNYYWLRFGVRNGKRMAVQQSLQDPPTVVPNKFLDAVFVEPDTFNILKSGKHWFSNPLSPGGSFVRALPLRGMIATEPRLYRYSLAASFNHSSTFTVREHDQIIGVHAFSAPDILSESTLGRLTVYEVSGTFPVTNNTSQIRFEFNSPNSGAVGYFDWLDIVYWRTFAPDNGNALRFRSPDTNGVVEYQLGQFSGAAAVFNVTDYANVKRVSWAGGSFRAAETRGNVSEYAAASNGGYRTPLAVTNIPNQDLRGITQRVDFIIVTSPEYMNAANRLKAHRESPAHGNLRTLIADVNLIYNEFGGGIPDVTAIRDFLKYAYENYGTDSTRPRFVLFLGQGSYDYKGVFGKTSYVPTWQTDESFDDISSAATDDYYVRFSPNSAMPHLVSGRLNARSTQQADFLVDRIIAYDTRSDRGEWKLRGVFVADDGQGEFWEGDLHTSQAEIVAELSTPDVFEKVKIYTEEYTTVQSSQGRRKPTAYQEIIDQINRGALFINFTGHGNPVVWTHESVFSVPTSIPLLTNANRLSYFFAATCNFSQFDDPSRQTGSEQLMMRVSGGAIGVISATRKVYSQQNFALNREIFNSMFRTEGGNLIVDRVATGLFLAKVAGGSGDVANDEKYFVLGDPTMQLQFPRRRVVVDQINEEPVDTVGGLERISPIQLKALAHTTMRGTVRTDAGVIDSSVSGRMTIVVKDATQRVRIPTFGSFSYRSAGATIFKGENSVSRGRFNANFIVPKDISYADSTTRGRVVAYFSNGSNDGAGYTSKIWIGGSDSTAQADSVGPSLKIYLGNSYESSLSFRPGDVVNDKPTLYVDLVDSSGINTSTSGIGHRIEAWINENPQGIDLTNFYTSKLDNFQAGTVTYPLRDLPNGRNTIRVRGWDTYNNARTAETFFEVLSSDKLAVVEVMNFPNPFSKTTAFTFKHNQAVPVSATVKVYTLAGRLIQTIEHPIANDPFVSISWDGRDRDGDEIANGVYLYKLHVRTLDGRFNSEVLGKLAIAK